MKKRNLPIYAWLLPLIGFAASWTLASQRPVEPISPNSAPQEVTPTAANETPLQANESSPASAEVGSSRAEHKPPVTVAEALSYTSEFHRMGALARLLEHAAAADFDKVHALLRKLNPETNRDLIPFFFRRWALVAPEAALAAALADEKSPFGGMPFDVLTAWAERDPEAALAKLDELPPGLSRSIREAILSLSLPRPGQFPPEDAIKKILQRQKTAGASPALINAAGQVFFDWTKTDPQAALRAVMALPGDTDGSLRSLALMNAFGAFAGKDAAAALTWMQAFPEGPDRAILEQRYVSTLAWDGHVREAREFAGTLPEGSARREAISSIAYALGRNDAPAARSFLASLSVSDFPDISSSAMLHVMGSWFRSAPEQAGEILMSHLPANPTPELRRRIEFIMSYCSDDRGRTELALKFPNDWREYGLRDSLGLWVTKDADTASDWAVNLEDQGARELALKQIAILRAAQGAEGVTAWIDTLPAGSGKSAAIEGFAGAIMSARPDDALAWLRAVPDDADRLARLRRAWNGWADREAAVRWRDHSGDLTKAERAALSR